MNTKYRIDIDVNVMNADAPRDFTKDIDNFVFGGYVDWIRRDENGCYVRMGDAWIPVVDWQKSIEFPGARDLRHIAKYFYNLGRIEHTPEKCLEGILDYDDISQLELAIAAYWKKYCHRYFVTCKHQRQVLMKLYALAGYDYNVFNHEWEDEK